ncbi:MAG: hypothetical protein ACRDQE_09445 [Gaiellales bacterium]
MRLEWLCDMDLAYRTEFTLVRPYGSEEGSGYGEGDGRVEGPRLSGAVRWVNHPHRRSDQTMLPDAHGLITTDNGSAVLFSLAGRTNWVGDSGIQVLTVTFESEADGYRWLNSAMHVFEGVIDPDALVIRAKIYSLVHELT